jgi:heterodisulfide reductase subunit A-like polyferredoxin
LEAKSFAKNLKPPTSNILINRLEEGIRMEEKKMRGDKGSALVIGAGIAGMQSALLLAEMGRKVFLLEQGPAIGGYFPLLDKTFPTNSCGVCFMSPTPPAMNVTFMTTSNCFPIQKFLELKEGEGILKFLSLRNLVS